MGRGHRDAPDTVFDLEHRLRIFVFHVAEDGIQYLLLRHKPVTEWPLGPVIGQICPGDQIRDAAVRQVQNEIGLARPVHLIELSKPSKELFGTDGGLVEWPVAWQAGSPHEQPAAIAPGPTVGECRWLPFEAAFQQIGTKRDRDTLVRLQLQLN